MGACCWPARAISVALLGWSCCSCLSHQLGRLSKAVCPCGLACWQRCSQSARSRKKRRRQALTKLAWCCICGWRLAASTAWLTSVKSVYSGRALVALVALLACAVGVVVDGVAAAGWASCLPLPLPVLVHASGSAGLCTGLCHARASAEQSSACTGAGGLRCTSCPSSHCATPKLRNTA